MTSISPALATGSSSYLPNTPLGGESRRQDQLLTEALYTPTIYLHHGTRRPGTMEKYGRRIMEVSFWAIGQVLGFKATPTILTRPRIGPILCRIAGGAMRCSPMRPMAFPRDMAQPSGIFWIMST